MEASPMALVHKQLTLNFRSFFLKKYISALSLGIAADHMADSNSSVKFRSHSLQRNVQIGI